MFTKLRYLLPALVLCGAVLFASASAFADDAKCRGAGYLCMYDYATTTYASVFYNNKSWKSIHGSNWNSRANWLRNFGTSQAVCVYSKHSYKGTYYLIKRGKAVDVTNFGRSNYWTSGVCKLK